MQSRVSFCGIDMKISMNEIMGWLETTFPHTVAVDHHWTPREENWMNEYFGEDALIIFNEVWHVIPEARWSFMHEPDADDLLFPRREGRHTLQAAVGSL